jgi:Skp family chaperone for outer membrane proteins
MVRVIALAVVVASASPALAQVVDSVRIAAVNLAYVARTSKIGKSELAKIDEVARKKAAEIESRASELQQQQVELQKSGLGLSPRAAADLQRAFDKSRVDLERFQQDARNEIAAMQTQFEIQFRAKLRPVIDEISKEKQLRFVFSIDDAPIAWWSPSVDLSDEVVRRLDAEKK